MLSAICFNMDQSEILSSGNKLKEGFLPLNPVTNPFPNKPWF